MLKGKCKPSFIIMSMVLSMTVWAGDDEHCSYHQPGITNLYWGDLHVHTAYSLDAYGYGTLATPAEAYEFARGGMVTLPDGPVRLKRPLDFVAVTDHAEWFDLLYVCTDPERVQDPYCADLRGKSSSGKGTEVFRDFVLPTITRESPAVTPICAQDAAHCNKASLNQWQRIQKQANEANDPCHFTAQIGYEWSATPSYSHSHRNIIFANENVTREAIDYIRYPNLKSLWEQLNLQCRLELGCDVIAIPHNTNMGDGTSFDVETESDRMLQLRSRYERLVEVHQEKGNSECLPPFAATGEGDCDFEIRLTDHSQPKAKANFSEDKWEKMRRTYVRGLLLRGLASYKRPERNNRNPLQLGLIGSTDNHSATPGHADEEQWQGSIFGFGDFDKTMSRLSMNPGGLVAVWAEENTRESLFAAMKRREVYGTSGPRITEKFSASTNGKPLSCSRIDIDKEETLTMGGEFSAKSHAPQFRIRARYDETPLEKIEIIKGEFKAGELKETRMEIWSSTGDGKNICQTWSDPDFDSSSPAFWYPRILEAPTPRWSAVRCKAKGRCKDYPQAVQTIQERAWASPIWYLPVN